MFRVFARRCSTSTGGFGLTKSGLSQRMKQELGSVFPAEDVVESLPTLSLQKMGPRSSYVRRKMPEHTLPNYIEANYKVLKFVYTRHARQSDFPNEK